MRAEEKAFAANMIRHARKAQPHLVWNGTTFTPGKPAPPPRMTVSLTVMHAAHERFGCRWKGSRVGYARPKSFKTIADTGCQTCTAGVDIIRQLCPDAYLVPTRHRIVGITDSSLRIVGMALLHITSESGRQTRQVVYVSENINGLYLSESALKDLGVIDVNFPNSVVDGSGSLSRAGQIAEQTEEEACKCVPRAATPERPESLPFSPTPENVPRLKEWLVQAFSSSAFNTCSHQQLQTMTGAPVKIKFKEGAQPRAVHTPIPVPHHWKKKVKSDIDRDVRLGIIEPVPQGTPTEWCSRMVVAAKKDGSPRRTVDLQELNKATLRETHHTPSPFNLVSTIPANTRKTVLDAWNGYHSLPLSEDTREATTFITEWGRYRYCRAPMGFHASGDAYTRRFDDITVGVPRVARIIDDSVLWDPEEDIADAFWHAFDYIKLCADNGIVFNEEKFVFAEPIVEFAGFEVHPEGFRPPQRIISSIENFPSPRTITDIRSWFGLVNQVAYAFAQADVMQPFRELLASKKRSFYWDETLEQLFEQSKQRIIQCVKEGVQTFEVDRHTCLSTDWSKIGIGYALFQKHCDCVAPVNPNCGGGHWKLIYAGSRFTRETESRYAPIEGEALALVYGLQSCRMFVLGSPNLLVTTDHKPLTRIFNDRSLDSIDNPRVRSFKEKSLLYQFEVEYIEGGLNCTPDWSSRNPVKDDVNSDADFEAESASSAYAMQQGDGISSVSWSQVREAAIFDEECSTLCEWIAKGFPNKKAELPLKLHYYWPMCDDLYVIEGVPFKARGGGPGQKK